MHISESTIYTQTTSNEKLYFELNKIINPITISGNRKINDVTSTIFSAILSSKCLHSMIYISCPPSSDITGSKLNIHTDKLAMANTINKLLPNKYNRKKKIKQIKFAKGPNKITSTNIKGQIQDQFAFFMFADGISPGPYAASAILSGSYSSAIVELNTDGTVKSGTGDDNYVDFSLCGNKTKCTNSWDPKTDHAAYLTDIAQTTNLGW